MKIKYPINENYFKSINSKSAYILGFIIADGCIISPAGKHSKYLTITLNSKDLNVLEFIRDEISPSRPISIIMKDDHEHCRLTIHSNILTKDLIDLGVISAKTGKECLPNIDIKYYPDLIRGLFDGDGCISQNKNNPGIIFQITSASLYLVTQLKEYFGFGYIRPGNKENTYYNFKVYKRDDIIKIRSIFYYGDIFSMSRKRTIFFNLKEIKRIEIFGESKKLSEWVRDDRCKVSLNCIKYRVKKLNMSYEEAIITPPNSKD